METFLNETTLTIGDRFCIKIDEQMVPYEITHGEITLNFIRNVVLKSRRLLVKRLAWSLDKTEYKKESKFEYYKPVDCDHDHTKLLIPNNTEYELVPIKSNSRYIKLC